MIRALSRPFRALFGRFSRSEDGTATIEFAITFPAMLFFMLSGIELGMASLQHSMLERAVDMTVREIRLGTGTDPTYDNIKAQICDRVGLIENCSDNLRLQMIQVDPRNWVDISSEPECTDQSQPVDPVLTFVNGQENELMILRVCAKFTPMFPTTGMGNNMIKDAAGQYALVSTSAFVQEPR